MTKDNRTNLTASHGQPSTSQPQKRGLLLSFIIFMAWVAGIGLLLSLVTCKPASAKQIATDDNSGYYIDLSKLISGHASRNPLAFFVPDNSVDSQVYSNYSSAVLKVQLSTTRAQSLITLVTQLPINYDELTLQNKRAERRICRAVATNTESKTRHPILLPYSVAFTQKLVGGYHA